MDTTLNGDGADPSWHSDQMACPDGRDADGNERLDEHNRAAYSGRIFTNSLFRTSENSRGSRTSQGSYDYAHEQMGLYLSDAPQTGNFDTPRNQANSQTDSVFGTHKRTVVRRTKRTRTAAFSQDSDRTARPESPSLIDTTLQCLEELDRRATVTLLKASGGLADAAESMKQKISAGRTITIEDYADIYERMISMSKSLEEVQGKTHEDVKIAADAVLRFREPQVNTLEKKIDKLVSTQQNRTWADAAKKNLPRSEANRAPLGPQTAHGAQAPQPRQRSQNAKTNQHPAANRQTRFYSVVTAMDKSIPGEAIRAQTTQALMSAAAGLGVIGVRGASNNTVMFESDSEASREKLMKKFGEAQELRDAFVIESARQKEPTIVLRGVTAMNNRDSNEFAELIIQANTAIRDTGVEPKEIRILFQQKARSRNGSLQDVVLRVPPKVRDAAIKQGRINVGFGLVRVEDYVNVTICYQCMGFGHQAKNCQGTQICSHCAGNHQFKQCPSQGDNTKAKCVNCEKTNTRAALRNPKAKLERIDHPSISRNCPQRKAMAAIVSARTNYG